MDKITPFLWFDGNAEEAIDFYTSIFDDAEILEAHRGSGGALVSARFKLAGREFMALNGGPHFKFTEAISLFVHCETQEEVDALWTKLSAGGQEGRCGWLKDKFSLSWQVIPAALGKMLHDPDPARSKRVMEAMMGMKKIDVAGLQKAYDGATGGPSA